VRKYNARKAFEREREENFVAEMLKAKPAPTAAAAPAATPKPSPADPLAAAAESIKAALAAGRGADAAKAFQAAVAQRTKLTLEPPVWEGLGRALLAQGAYMEAAWALHAGAALAGDLLSAQKRLVEVAARAGDAGQAHNALKLYATLLAKYPQSQYADFVRANMKAEENKLPKA
jgi:predicted Zn-dependent protease